MSPETLATLNDLAFAIYLAADTATEATTKTARADLSRELLALSENLSRICEQFDEKGETPK